MRSGISYPEGYSAVYCMPDVPFALPIHFVFGERDVLVINIDPEV